MGAIDGHTGTDVIAPNQKGGHLRWDMVEVEDHETGLGLEAFFNRHRRLVSQPEERPHRTCRVLTFELRIKLRSARRIQPIGLKSFQGGSSSAKLVQLLELDVPSPEHAKP